MDAVVTLDPKWVGSSVVAVLATLLVFTKWSTKQTHDAAGIPWYPGGLTGFFGHFFSWDAPQHTLETFQELKDCIFRVPVPFGPAFYIVRDPTLARQVSEDTASTKFDDANQFIIETTNGMNFFAAKGHRWKHVRKSTVAAFSSDNVKRMVDVVQDVMTKWIQQVLDPAVANGSDIDILSEMHKITSNVICQVAFDYDLTDNERKIILDNLEICWREFGQEGGKNPLRQSRFTKHFYQGVRDGQEAAEVLYGMCEFMLGDYREKIKTDATQAQPHKIVHMINADNEYANDNERISDMVAFVIAGFDTTANTLSFAFRELAKNKAEQDKLRAAIRECKTPEEARACVALKYVVREIMRLYPAAATGSVRQIGRDFPVPTPHQETKQSTRTLPKGSIVLANYYSIHRNSQIYGDDADQFIPSRWENATQEQNRAFLGFSAGKRNCQGQSLAMAEMTGVIACLCRDYEFEIAREGRPENFVLFKPIGTLLKARKVE